MKKIITLLLLLIISLNLFGCSEKASGNTSEKTYRLAWDGFCYGPSGFNVKLEGTESKYILDLLNNSVWENGLVDCDYDFYFLTQRERIIYHSLCGTFNDTTNEKVLKVTEEQRLEINGFLKDSESPRYVWEGFYYVVSDYPIKLKLNGAEYIDDLLNNCIWENGNPDCPLGGEPDYYFLKPRQLVYYHSECGTFYDMENGKVFIATEEQRLTVNSFFDNGTEYILDLVINSAWKSEQPDSHSGCDSVYYLLEPKLHISYHSECGTFYDTENGVALKSTEEQRLKINSFLENGEYEE